MKTAEADILFVPGFRGSEPEHWQARWLAKLSTARWLTGIDITRASKAEWVGALVAATAQATRPVVIIAHSIGVIATAHAAPQLKGVAGAFLVGLSDWERPNLLPGVEHDFAPIPRDPLPFPSLLVASRTDPYCDFDRAEDFSYAWGSSLVDAGDAGHINVASGHGPWPEGLMRLAGFLPKLPVPGAS